MELIRVRNQTAEELVRQLLLCRELGHTEALLLFATHDRKNQELADAVKKRTAGTPAVTTGILIRDQNQAKLGRQYDAVVAPCSREFFETRAVTHILDPENGARPDFIHHRNSGLNQVVLALAVGDAKRRPKAILSSFTQLLGKRPATALGRMAQNARWCAKYKVRYLLVSGAASAWEQRAATDLKALHRILLER